MSGERASGTRVRYRDVIAKLGIFVKKQRT